MAMTPMSTGDIIFLCQVHACSDSYGFLTNIEMG
jgi:hypothetical protein